MEIILIIILTVIIFILVLAAMYVNTFNKIQNCIIRLQSAESKIDDSLRKKFDLLKLLEDEINSKLTLNQNNFKDFEDEKIKISNFELDRKLTKVYDTFNKIRIDYPEDLDLESVRNLFIDLSINEEKTEASKMYYNKYTTKLNEIIKKFPSNIIAKLHGIGEHNYFDNKNMNDANILDFKL